jgi:hypothetical protein
MKRLEGGKKGRRTEEGLGSVTSEQNGIYKVPVNMVQLGAMGNKSDM